MEVIKKKSKRGKFVPINKNTKIKTIEKKYNIDLGVRSDMKISNYLKLKGFPSLAAMIE